MIEWNDEIAERVNRYLSTGDSSPAEYNSDGEVLCGNCGSVYDRFISCCGLGITTECPCCGLTVDYTDSHKEGWVKEECGCTWDFEYNEETGECKYEFHVPGGCRNGK